MWQAVWGRILSISVGFTTTEPFINMTYQDEEVWPSPHYP